MAGGADGRTNDTVDGVETLRRQLEVERRTAEEATRRAEQLARTVAELERAERELTQMNRALAESDRRKDEFLAVLAHELRNTLAPIVNSLELLKLQLDETPHAALQRVWNAIERQTYHLTRLVDDLLDLSRINSGKIELRTERMALEDIVLQAVSLSHPWIQQRGHTLDVRIVDPGLEVVADAVRMAQVLSNLLNNAARYTDPGGRIELSCYSRGGQACVDVKDSGYGIPPELLDKMFDMFVQERSGGGGLGIGLSLVRSLVELHGGRVSATSDGPGLGSVFTVELPLANDEDALRPLRRSESIAEASTPLFVAIVDDNPDVRETLRELLLGWGHRVMVASDGAQGVDLILNATPAIALVDIGLPILDGYEVAQAVRARQTSGRTRLVAVTGFGRESDRQRALDAGFDAHLVKPATAENLLQALALARPEPHRTAPASL